MHTTVDKCQGWLRIALLVLTGVTAAGCANTRVSEATVTTGTQFAVDGNPAGDALYMDLQGLLWKLPRSGGPAQALSTINDDIRRMRLSPDGTRVAFQTFARGFWDIAVADADGDNRVVLTRGPHDHRGPDWSADGRTLFFGSDRSGNYDIWSVDIATGALTQITDDPADDYAPTVVGTTLAFISERSRKPALYTLDLATNAAPVQIATAPAGTLHPPRLSPDGRRIAWVQALQRNGFPSVAINQLVVLDIATGVTRVLSPAGSDVFSQAPAWLDASTLLYTGDGTVQRLRLDDVTDDFADDVAAATIPFAATLPLAIDPFRQLTPAVFTLAAGRDYSALGIVDPLLLPDGSVAFTALGDLYIQNANGALKQLTDDAFVERDLSVTPDGRALAYISDRDGSMQIWLHYLADNTTQRLTSNSPGPRYPAFSPDGSRLAYMQVGPLGTQDFGLRILDLATGKVTRLRAAAGLWPGRIAWSADGTHVTVAELHKTSERFGAGANRLVRINIGEDTATVEDLGGRIPDFGPAASYAHDKLALVIDGALWTVTVNPDGAIAGAPRLVLDELVEAPAWSFDGQRILVLTNSGLATCELATGQLSGRNPELAWQAAAGAGRRLVHAGRLWDGYSETYQLDMDILIEGARIVSVKPHATHPPNVTILDAAGKTVLPGLIDHHVHFEPHHGEIVGRQLLAFGITTVVEPGGLPYESREHMEAWASGRRAGPRIVYAGPQLDGARKVFHFATHVNSAERIERELERGARLGYGMVKTYESLRPELQAQAVRLAHEQGLPVSAHAAFRNLGNGGDRIEHLRGSSRLASSPKQSDLLKSYGDIEAIIAGTKASVTPTVVNQGGYFEAVRKSPELTQLPQYVALYSEAYRDNRAAFAKFVSRQSDLISLGVANAGASIARLEARGTNLVAGTDSPIFPYGLALVIELANYVDAGLTPAAALRAATSNAAAELGAESDVGGVQAGKLADLIVVAGDPLADIRQVARVEQVLIGGRTAAP